MGDNLARYPSLRRVLGEILFAMGDNLGRYTSLHRVVLIWLIAYLCRMI